MKKNLFAQNGKKKKKMDRINFGGHREPIIVFGWP